MTDGQRFTLSVALACAAASFLNSGQMVAVGVVVGVYVGYIRRVDWGEVGRQVPLLWGVLPCWARVAVAVVAWRFVPGGTWLVVGALGYVSRVAIASTAREGMIALRYLGVAWQTGKRTGQGWPPGDS